MKFSSLLFTLLSFQMIYSKFLRTNGERILDGSEEDDKDDKDDKKSS